MHFQFAFPTGMEVRQALLKELRRLDAPTIGRSSDCRHQILEIVDSLAAAQVNSDSGAIDSGGVEQIRIFEGLLGGSEREPSIDAAIRPTVRIRQKLIQFKIENLGRKTRAKRSGIEMSNRPNGTSSFAGPSQTTFPLSGRAESPRPFR